MTGMTVLIFRFLLIPLFLFHVWDPLIYEDVMGLEMCETREDPSRQAKLSLDDLRNRVLLFLSLRR